MKTKIQHGEPRVTLDLSADEFVALWGLFYAKGDGNTRTRYQMEADLADTIRAVKGTVIERAVRAFQETSPARTVFERADEALARARE